jgi:hypothetical protein
MATKPSRHGALTGREVVRIEIGHSILDAERIAQLATASGLQVQLLRNEHPETGSLIALGTCVLLVSRQDEADLRQLLADFGYQV